MQGDHTTPPAANKPIPSSVWVTGQQSLPRQLTERSYLHDTLSDTDAIAPAIAEHAVTLLTRPSEVVLDPDCGAGTTLVEALRAGRHAIGATAQPRWWYLARANVTAAKARGALSDGMVLTRHQHGVLPTRPSGSIDLLLTTLRTASTDRSPEPDFSAVLAGIDALRAGLSTARPLLRPGAHVAIIVPPRRDPTTGELHDLIGYVLALGIAARLTPVARPIALTAALARHYVKPDAGPVEYRRVSALAQRYRHPIAIPAHHTVLIFRADPDTTCSAATAPTPRPRTRLRSRIPIALGRSVALEAA